MILRADSLGFDYPDRDATGGFRCAVAALSTTFLPGEVTALLGPNGSGKTTLLRLLTGLLKPTRGSATIAGLDISALAPDARARRIAYMPQRDEDAGEFTVAQTVAFGRFAAADEHSPAGIASIEYACQACGLSDSANRQVRTLSSGQRQRVHLARAICQCHANPGIAFLADEPAAALDPAFAALAGKLLKQQAANGSAVVVAMHDLATAARLADRVILLAPGGLTIAEGSPDDVMTSANLERAYGTPIARHATPAGPAFLSTFTP